MNFPYNKIFVAQKLSEWQNFKDCTLFAAVCGAKDKLESVPRMWEYVPNCVEGPGKCGRSLSDMFGGMSVENKSVFGCPEVRQRRDSAKGECGDHVCLVKSTLTKDTICIVRKDVTVKQRWVGLCQW